MTGWIDSNPMRRIRWWIVDNWGIVLMIGAVIYSVVILSSFSREAVSSIPDSTLLTELTWGQARKIIAFLVALYLIVNLWGKK
jgi:hypothetical protein